MNSMIKPTKCVDASDPKVFEQAAQLLASGRLVAFPTETVYGLGADAVNPDAVCSIFEAKGRPSQHPLIVHGASATDWSHCVELNDWAERLMHRFWPGPLTLILNKTKRIPDVVTGGQKSVGIRCPDHWAAQALLRAFSQVGSGLVAAPSANRFTQLSPTQACHVMSQLEGRIDWVIDAGACEVGLESTIVDLTADEPTLLRPGMISVDALEQELNRSLASRTSASPRASGDMAKHYSPRTVTRLIPPGTVGLMRLASLTGRKIVALCINDAFFAKMLAQNQRESVLIKMPSEPPAYAREIYAALHQADSMQCDLILVEQPPNLAVWLPVIDRLKRAAT